MSTKNHLISMLVFLITTVLFSACAPQVGGTSTAAPLPTTPATTAPLAANQTPSAKFEGLSSGLDNAKQARIRTVNEVMGSDMMEVYVNGLPAFNGGMPQQNIFEGRFSGFLYVVPGTYSVALVPHGKTIDQALFPPLDVKVEAGHRYTVAAMGQLADKDVHPLVVDETTLEAGLGAGDTDSLTIDINNMKGADSITEQADGKTWAENIKYGEARAWSIPSGSPVFVTLANKGAAAEKIYDEAGFAEPGISVGLPWFGTYPASNYDSVGIISQATSELNVLDFLKGFDGRDVKIDGHLATFNTFLAAIEKAGLQDQFGNGGPYFLMAPIDEAFASMSQAEKDALLADPQALKSLLDAHIVDGYYPSGSLSGSIYGHADRTIKNRLGNDLKFFEDSLNGVPIGPNYTVGNGNRVQIIFTLLPYK